MLDHYDESVKIIEKTLRTKSILKKWVVVADRYLRLYTNNMFERHLTAQDIIQEFCLRVLTQKRNWDPEKQADFNQFAFNSFRSIIEGLVSARKIVKPGIQNSINQANDEFQISYDKYATEKDAIFTNFETDETLEWMRNKLLGDPANPDDDCGLVFLLWKEGRSSKEIAEYFNNDVSEVENIKKRIRYKLYHK